MSLFRRWCRTDEGVVTREYVLTCQEIVKVVDDSNDLTELCDLLFVKKENGKTWHLISPDSDEKLKDYFHFFDVAWGYIRIFKDGIPTLKAVAKFTLDENDQLKEELV